MKRYITAWVGWIGIFFAGILSAESLVVAIDPGHTLKHFGCVSARGVSEYHYNIVLSRVLKKEVDKADGMRAFIVNPDGGAIALKKRTAQAEKRGADIFLSLHHDSAQLRYFNSWIYEGKKIRYSDRFSGYSLFVSSKNLHYEDSLRLATCLGEAFCSHNQHPTLHHAEKIEGENRELLDSELGIYRFDDLIVLKSASMPAVLLENGLIVNRDEEKRLSTVLFRKAWSRMILEGLKCYKKRLQKDPK